MTKYKIINRKKAFATMLADLLGWAIFWPLVCLRRKRSIDHAQVKSILVIRVAYIGDVIMTLPMLKPLKERFPQARITFLTSSHAKPVLENNPYVDEILTFNPFWFYKAAKSHYCSFIRQLRSNRYDLAIDARGDIRNILFLVMPTRAAHKISYAVGGGQYLLTDVVPYSGLTHKVDYHLNIARHLGCDTDQTDDTIHLTEEEQRHVASLLSEANLGDGFVAAHPGSRLPLKQWPLERCAELYDRIIEEYKMPLVLLGVQKETHDADRIINSMRNKPITMVGKLNLRELAGVIGQAELVICNDSGPMHLAAAMQTRVVAIFGPSKPEETAPYGKDHQVVSKSLDCHVTCDESHCTSPTFHACMQGITVNDVFTSVRRALDTTVPSL